MKENQQVAHAYNPELNQIVFTVRGMAEPIVLEMDALHPDVKNMAAVFGMAQVRIIDAAAVGMTDDDGNIIPAEERLRMKHESMRVLVEHYNSGSPQWKRTGTGTGGARSITIEAIARVQDTTYENVVEMLQRREEKTGKKRAALLAELRKAAAVDKAIRAIRAERAPKTSIDADEALNALIAE